MTGKTQAARQPSIDELLASIRQAIHERVAPEKPCGADAPARPAPMLVHTAPAARPSPENAQDEPALETAGDRLGMKRTIVTSSREGFAGLLGGDVRLKEALARLQQTGAPRRPDASVAAPAAQHPAEAAAAPAAEPTFRPTIDDWTGGPGAHKRPAADRAAPEPSDPGKEGRMHDERSTAPRPAPRPAKASASQKTDDLLSSQAASAAQSAFNRLTDAMAPRATARERPLDEMTRDCLRPLLKAWLDENLPGMVERLVREEIARVARPGR